MILLLIKLWYNLYIKVSKFGTFGEPIFLTMESIYAFAIISIFICSLGNRPQGSRWLYLGCIILFAIVMLYVVNIKYINKYININNYSKNKHSYILIIYNLIK